MPTWMASLKGRWNSFAKILSRFCSFHPVGRAAQAAACKAAEAGAIPARDSIFRSAELRFGPNQFLHDCQRADSEIGAPIFRDVNTGAGHDFTGLTAVVQLRLSRCVRVANFDSEVPALNRRELGAIPRRPTISPMWLSSDSSSFVNCRALPHESASLSIGPISLP